MPNKVNPIEFENAEGNFGLSNSLLEFFTNKLSRSRLQRDLSDSTVIRNIGVALGHSLVAIKNLLKGLNYLQFNQQASQKDLDSHFEVLMEPVQLYLKSQGNHKAYDEIKYASQGVTMNEAAYKQLVKIYKSQKLNELTPNSYVGAAGEIANDICKEIDHFIQLSDF